MSATHCHADSGGPCLAKDCPIAGLGPLIVRGSRYLRPCPGAPGSQHPATAPTADKELHHGD